MPRDNWTYPYDYYPVYAMNQNVSGTFFGPGRMADSLVALTVLLLSTSSFSGGFEGDS